MSSTISSLRRVGIGALLFAGMTLQALAQGANRLEGITFTTGAGNKVELTLKLSDNAPTPLTFTVDMRTTSGTFVATASVTVVAVNAADFTRRSLPDAVRTALAPFSLTREEARAAAATREYRADERGNTGKGPALNPLNR